MRRWNHSDHGYQLIHVASDASVVLAVLFKGLWIFNLHKTQPFPNFAVAIWFWPIILDSAQAMKSAKARLENAMKAATSLGHTWPNMPPMCDYVSDGRLSSLVTASPKDLSQESSSDEEGSSRRINGSIIDRFKISWICFKRFDRAKACWSLGVHTSWGRAFLEANLPWGWRLDVYLMCIICEIYRNLLFVCYCCISSWCLSSQYIYIYDMRI